MRATLCLLLAACSGDRETAARSVTSGAPAAPEQVVGDVRFHASSIADLDGDGVLELAAGGFTTTGDRRRASVFIYRQAGDGWRAIADGGWLGGGGGNGSTVRNVEVADLDGDGKVEVIALGRVGSKTKEASARLVVLSLEGGKLRERARIEWNAAVYTHGYGLAIGDVDGDHRLDIVTAGFLYDGSVEHGFVRVWSFADGSLALRNEAKLAGTPEASVRINDVAIGDVDGDGRAEIVTAGRTGAYRAHGSDDGDARRERGDIAIFDGATLGMRARHAWLEGDTLRLRTVAIAKRDIVVGGQAGDKPCIGVFAVHGSAIEPRTHVIDSEAGEIKDVIVAGDRILAATPSAQHRRDGDVTTWRLDGDQLVRERETVAVAAVLDPEGRVVNIAWPLPSPH